MVSGEKPPPPPPKDPNAVGYWVDDPLPMKFLQNENFRSHLQKYLENFLSTKIAITLQRPPKDEQWWWRPKIMPDGFMIELLDMTGSETMNQTLSDFCRTYFNKIGTEEININNGS